jgi:23S rRNA pseudouridine2605 synthase
VTELGTRANPHRDRITIDGKLLRAAPPPVYILLNKPVGVMTTLIDPEGRPTVRDLVSRIHQRIFPVGRLDFHSAGLLLLTNDGELAMRLTHPRYGIRKTYEVKVKGRPEPTQLAALARGVKLPDGVSAPAAVRVLEPGERKTWLSITLAEGKNRQVRRMCETVGLPVEKLTRVALGPLALGKLPPGAWRHLEPHELAALRAAAVAGGRHEVPPAARGRSPERRRRKPRQPAEPRRRSAPQSEAAPGPPRTGVRNGRGRRGVPRSRRRVDSR